MFCRTVVDCWGGRGGVGREEKGRLATLATGWSTEGVHSNSASAVAMPREEGKEGKEDAGIDGP